MTPDRMLDALMLVCACVALASVGAALAAALADRIGCVGAPRPGLRAARAAAAYPRPVADRAREVIAADRRHARAHRAGAGLLDALRAQRAARRIC